MRLVFAGTPEAAVPALDALLKSRHEVTAVITRPDAPAGRGLHLVPSPVAERAAEAGVEVLKPVRPREPEFIDRLRHIAPDCAPVTAYGALIPQSVLDIPAQGWVNLHFSVLPAWRGAAPVQHAILHGDDITGATTFRLVKELDAGPVFGVVTEPIRPDDTAGDLLGRLAVSGAELLVATLDGIESGQLEARPQPAEGVSLAPKITAEDARVRWDQPGRRGGPPDPRLHPEPGGLDHAGGGAAEAVAGRPGPGRCGLRRALSPPARCGSCDPRSWSAPRPRRSGWGTSSRRANGGCAPPTGPAGSATTPRCWAEGAGLR